MLVDQSNDVMKLTLSAAIDGTEPATPCESATPCPANPPFDESLSGAEVNSHGAVAAR